MLSNPRVAFVTVMNDSTAKLGDPGRPLPHRPIRAAVGRLNRSPKPEPAAAPPPEPKSGLSYNIKTLYQEFHRTMACRPEPHRSTGS